MDVIDTTQPFAKGHVLAAIAEMDLARWIALSRIEGLGCVGFKKLAEHFNDPTAAFSAPATTLAEIHGLDKNIIYGLRNFSAWDEV